MSPCRASKFNSLFMMRWFPKWYLLPFDGAGWFGADVINNASHATNFVHDASGHAFQNFTGEAHPVGGHGIVGFDNPNGYSKAVGTVVTHDAYASNGEQNGKGLPNLAIEPG